jgi:tetratricopeptide (TPR) repeat protein
MAVLAEHSGHPEVGLQRAKWALEEGDPTRALELLEALLVDAGSPRQLRARGWSLAAIARDSLGDPEGALAAADTAIALDRTSPAPYVTLAGLAARRGDDTEALAHLRRAWGMAPADIGLLHRIAAVARRGGRLSDARLALERAVELEPEEPRHVVALTDVLLETGEYSRAAVALSRGLDRFPANPALLQRAERLRREVDGF